MATPDKRGQTSKLLASVSSIKQIVRLINSLSNTRQTVSFGVEKRDGVSIERERRDANQAAIQLLNTLIPGDPLTDAQRQTLAGYTGEGGIGGSEYEYYTPQYVAEGMWDLLAAYGVNGGLGLEPAAGTGVFQETKPKGMAMQAAELSDVSGRINQLLHPEDNVNVSPFEDLARVTPDNSFDHCVGNVPFGSSRGGYAERDPAYKNESLAGYFVLRPIDKVKPGGLITLIVPNGLTHNSGDKKLRDRVSRKAEFLGAHRLPSGTFSNNGTATVVDVWVLRKHPEDLAERIETGEDNVLREANVLWDTFINGKWFDRDGRKFIHGTMTMEGKDKFARLVVKPDGQINQASVKAALARRFESRINWDLLALNEPAVPTVGDGEKRLINGIWKEFVGGRWLVDDAANYGALDEAAFGAKNYDDLRTRLSTSEGILSLDMAQLENVVTRFPDVFPQEYQSTIRFAMSQKPALRQRVLRGSVIGARIRVIQDKLATGYQADSLELQLADLQKQVSEEVQRSGNPHNGKSAAMRGEGAANWLKFKASVTKQGELTALLTGTLDAGTAKTHDASDHEQVLRHLFNQIDLDPIELATFRAAFEGALPENDNELLNLLAQKDGIAVQPDGTLIPMDRATSGDIGALNSALMGALAGTPDGAIKDNYMRQLAEIKSRRKWTGVDDIDFSLNARWFDRRLVMEFLHERGYEDVKYIDKVDIKNGALVSENGYSGRDGVFTGYRYKTVQQRDKESGTSTFVYKRVRNQDGFLDQFENYLNGVKPRGPLANTYLEKIGNLEEEFNTWVRQHDDIDQLVQEYNDAFNAFIPFSHSEESLNLKGVSSARIPFSYQNAEVRRLSEDGRGINAFGTGVGKTTTALALEAYNYENGRSKRTAIVVPKAVYQNWYYEAQEFYSPDALANMLFVGLDEVKGDDGQAKQVPVLDDKGEQVINPNTGLATFRNAVSVSTTDTIKERMNMIPMSNYRTVIMTKEQFAAIPLRPETVDTHAREVLFAEADAGRVNLDGTKHRDAAKKNRIIAKASDTGSAKKEEFPYFEDMLFDSVIADEGHNYRNSFATGREASQLAYLPTNSVAKSARDFALKSSYLMKKHNGRGPVLLTATPLVNSPVDAFNMLSHVVSQDEWQRMGILTPDDFVKVFGLTEMVNVMKISGEIEQKQGLVGFKNLDGLRGIFHRWTTLKTAQDVSDTVKIPELDERNIPVPMTSEQGAIYEELRQRADNLSNGNSDDNEDGERDSIFSIIRDMDRVCIDPDLYHRQMTFRFPVEKLDAVKQLVDTLPVAVKATDDEQEDSETVSINVTAKIAVTADYVEIIVPEAAEEEVLKRLPKFGVNEKDVSHPVPPKYSALVENVKAGLEDGKQIIFTDEKTQHGKLKRILAAALGIEPKEIGILNATTVADAGKKGKAPKAVKLPKEPKDDATNEELQGYYAQKEAYDSYIASKTEASLGGMESIAADYNEGRTRILICNKKAEVGINLHHGTRDIHHLTLPWTPASIAQRNGRGARVGSKASSVRVHYYCGKGSFDEFRVKALKNKANWTNEILTSDQARMANADANSQEEMNLLLAANPEDYARRVESAKKKAEAAARAAAKKRADIDLAELVKMQHALTLPVMTIQSTIKNKTEYAENRRTYMASKQAELQEAIDKGQQWVEKTTREEIKKLDKDITDAQSAIRRGERQLMRAQKAEQRIKQLRPEVERAINSGLLDVDVDILTHGEKYVLLADGRTLKKGAIYESRKGSGTYVRILSLDLDASTASCQEIFKRRLTDGLSKAIIRFEDIGASSDIPESEASLREWGAQGQHIYQVTDRATKEDFVRMLRAGQLLLADENAVYRDSEGKFALHRLRESKSWGYGTVMRTGAMDWLTHNADIVVFPDTNDNELKASVAGWSRSLSSNMGIEPLLIALFGRDYKSELENYGETATAGQIATAVAEYLTARLNGTDTEGRNFAGEGKSQYGAYLLQGQYDPSKYIDFHVSVRNTAFIPGQYKNQRDFSAALVESTALKTREHLAATVVTAREHAHKAWLNFRDQLKAPVEEILEMLSKVPDTADQMAYVYRSYSRNPLDYEANNYDILFAHAVRLGLADENAITEDCFNNSVMLQQTVERINKAFSEKKSDRDALVNQLKLDADLISQAEIDAAKAAKAARAEEEKADAEAALKDSITVKRNSQALTGGKGANRFNYGPDEAICLQDADGKDGALYRAKDILKTSFGAKYHNGKISGQELMGSWWIVSAQHSIQEVLAVISSHK
ncbi:helicase-related protein [Pantoea agglomerans]|uniref:helicase-related protein n=1 Tax=Enterobacter agglomerans TaxID=549 RepID=UPI00301624DC